jgi:hypothetical protein
MREIAAERNTWKRFQLPTSKVKSVFPAFAAGTPGASCKQ